MDFFYRSWTTHDDLFGAVTFILTRWPWRTKLTKIFRRMRNKNEVSRSRLSKVLARRGQTHTHTHTHTNRRDRTHYHSAFAYGKNCAK